MNNHLQQSGVTLIELMATLLIVSILGTVGIGTWSSSVERNRISSSTNEFIRGIRAARNAAQDRQALVNMTANPSAGDNEWGNGWSLFDTSQVAPNNLVMVSNPISTSIRIDAINAVDTTLSFDDNGIRTGTNNAVFTVCSLNNSIAGRQITVSILGRVKITNRNLVCP